MQNNSHKSAEKNYTKLNSKVNYWEGQEESSAPNIPEYIILFYKRQKRERK